MVVACGMKTDAAAYVNERGFVHLFAPGKLPLAESSVTRNCGPGAVIETFSLNVWHWKNTLPAKQSGVPTGTHLRNRGIFISWRLLSGFSDHIWGLHEPVDRVLGERPFCSADRASRAAGESPCKVRSEIAGSCGARCRHFPAPTKRQYQAALARACRSGF